ncbi:hypothetical protein BDQ17DRAFT_1353580 [Cyathus striatus]|nr:hypothetical protein BDQ17DRAFT_1353580 [Cyathus striatus]
MVGSSLPTLQPKQAVVLRDTTDLKFTHPHSSKRCVIKRTQIPLLPAFAMTAHKAQGKTLEKVIVDLQSCRGTEAPYVMVSRVKSLAGLAILRPFSQAKISSRQSQDVRTETKRLDILDDKTRTRFYDLPEFNQTHTFPSSSPSHLSHSPPTRKHRRSVDSQSTPEDESPRVYTKRRLLPRTLASSLSSLEVSSSVSSSIATHPDCHSIIPRTHQSPGHPLRKWHRSEDTNSPLNEDTETGRIYRRRRLFPRTETGEACPFNSLPQTASALTGNCNTPSLTGDV